MNRQTALDLLTAHKPHLQHQFGVRSLALFGSTARGTASEGSDVDVLVSFFGPASSKQYVGAQFYLEDLLKCPVDLLPTKRCAKSSARM
jgi:uncharacterized protein